jgi:hypothetical protein
MNWHIPSLPSLPPRGWSKHTRGYIVYTSRATYTPIKRGTFLHRAVVETLIGRPLLPGEVVHHMDFDKKHNCPHNLLLTPMELHAKGHARQCPHTGRWLSKVAWERIYGESGA